MNVKNQKGLRRFTYLAIGYAFLGLGLVGAFLPLLPTTVFLLIAAWAFSRSSERWHRWLREHARFGPTLRAWEAHRAMPRRAKRLAYAALAVSYALTAGVFGPFSGVAVVTGLCLAGVAVFIAQMPIWDDPKRQRCRA
ncbi:MAG: YbaN family protein [Sedimenticolaceae bacterium]